MKVLKKSQEPDWATKHRYPWDEWMDAERDKDFTCTDRSFSQLLRATAKKHGVMVNVRIVDEGVAFKFESNGEA